LGSKPLGFPKSRRLIRPQEFRQVFQRGTRKTVPLFNFHYHHRPAGDARLGIAVGKRYVRSAVRRNRLKRLIREAFRHHTHILPPVDIVVVTRQPAGAAAGRELSESLRRFFMEMGRRSRTNP